MTARVTHEIPLVHVTSLGCSKNWVDTEIILAGLLQKEFGISPESNDANLWLINTCGFITSAREETEAAIRRAITWKKRRPARRKIVVTGCICAWENAEDVIARYPAVDLWLKPDDVPNAHEHIAALWYGATDPVPHQKTPFLYDHTTPRVQLTPEHYAYVKIADGCDNKCSYCAIPKIRGRSRSRTIASVAEEVTNLVNLGVKEIILIGQDITRFGQDRDGGETLVGLLRALETLQGTFWIRLLYLHPARYSDELTELYASAKHLIPYLEMPIQHIDAEILKSMNRAVNPGRIREIFLTLRQKVPQIALRTTFIIGYPGETEAQFEKILDLLREIRFDRVGAFVYQPEPGTPAATMPDQVPKAVAEERYQRLMTLQSEISEAQNLELVGETLEILVDEADGEWVVGRTYRDAPDIDNKVIVRNAKKIREPGCFINGFVTAASPYELLARYVPPATPPKIKK